MIMRVLRFHCECMRVVRAQMSFEIAFVNARH